eukprot:3884378-Rhodomonas_salina.3
MTDGRTESVTITYYKPVELCCRGILIVKDPKSDCHSTKNRYQCAGWPSLRSFGDKNCCYCECAAESSELELLPLIGIATTPLWRTELLFREKVNGSVIFSDLFSPCDSHDPAQKLHSHDPARKLHSHDPARKLHISGWIGIVSTFEHANPCIPQFPAIIIPAATATRGFLRMARGVQYMYPVPPSTRY